MNTVSFETAKALRDAGFPQPEPAPGQFWYNPDYGLFVVGRRSFVDGTMRNIFYFEPGKTYEKSIDSFLLCVFAPTATDILAELESDFDISCLQDKNWMVICRNAADQPISYLTEPNPHEAAAKAYLQLHKPA